MNRIDLYNHICPFGCGIGCMEDDSMHCADCHMVMDKWLDEYDKEVYNKAIDDFLVRLNNRIVPGPYDYIEKKGFEIMAEQLKKNLGNKEERK